MIGVRFIGLDGHVTEVQAAPGSRLLDVAQSADQPLEGTCGGDMACGTCHVGIERAAELLPEPSADEEDLLDMLPNAGRTSRLACQIRLSAGLPPLTVHIR